MTSCHQAVLFIVFLAAVASATAQDPFPPTHREEAKTSWPVSGKVTTSLGVPVPGAIVRSVWSIPWQFTRDADAGVWTTAKCDVAGQFDIYRTNSTFLVASAPGFASTPIPISSHSFEEILLDTGRSIQGTVTLPDGSPAEGVSVQPVQIRVDRETFGREDESDSSRPLLRSSIRYSCLSLPDLGKSSRGETNREGEFAIDHMPTQHAVGLLVSRPGYFEQLVWVPAAVPVDARGEQSAKDAQIDVVLQACTVLKLTGKQQESGNPEPIESVLLEIRHGYGIMLPDNRFPHGRHYHFENKKSACEISLPRLSGDCILWIQPASDDRLGVRIELTSTGQARVIEQEIEFPEGNVIEGSIIDEVNGSPIADAGINWSDEEWVPFTTHGTFAKLDIASGRDGSYSIAVPKQVGCLGVYGGIPGYQTTGFWKPQYQSLHDRFVRRIVDGQAYSGDRVDPNFRLSPAPKLKLALLRTNGEPAGNAVVTTSADTALVSSRSGYRWGSSRTYTADQDGLVELTGLFTLAPAIAAMRGERNLAQPRFNGSSFSLGDPQSRQPRIEVFSSDGLLQAVALVPVPEKSIAKPIELTLALQPTADVEGFVIDENGNPVSGIKISAQSSFGTHTAHQVWWTHTRKDGRFKLTGLAPQTTYQLHIGTTDEAIVIGSNPWIPAKSLQPGGSIALPTMQCLDFRSFLAQAKRLEISDLDATDAIERIEAFAEMQLEFSLISESQRAAANGRIDEPIGAFADHVADQIHVAAKQLLERPMPADERRVLIERLAKVMDLPDENSDTSSFRSRIRFGRERSEYLKWLLEEGTEHFLDDKDSQGLLHQIASNISYQTPGLVELLERIVRDSAETPLRQLALSRCVSLELNKFSICVQAPQMYSRSIATRCDQLDSWLDKIDSPLLDAEPALERQMQALRTKLEQIRTGKGESGFNLPKSKTSPEAIDAAKRIIARLDSLLPEQPKQQGNRSIFLEISR